jgi:hypothetical protein
MLTALHITILYYIFALKKAMGKEQIQAILDNASEVFLERFYETLLNEINSDDEPYHKKAYHLLLASLKSEDPDDFFISLCGWSLDTLFEKI